MTNNFLLRLFLWTLMLVGPACTLVQAGPPSERLRAAREVEANNTEQAANAYRPGKLVHDSLKSIRCVHQIRVTGPKQPTQTIIHIRDWHFLMRDVFSADIRAASGQPISDATLDKLYAEFLLRVERVQVEQRAILRCLIRHHGLRQVYCEGLAGRDMPIFKAEIGVMKELEAELPGYRAELTAAKQHIAESRRAGSADSDECRINEELAFELEGLLRQHRLDLLRIGATG